MMIKYPLGVINKKETEEGVVEFNGDDLVDVVEETFYNILRDNGLFKYKSFLLDCSYNWSIVKDDMGVLILVPTKKKEKA